MTSAFSISLNRSFAAHAASVLLTMMLPGWACAFPVSCPARYSVYNARVQQVPDAPAGWTAFVQGNFPLRSGGVIEGPEDKNGILRPEVFEHGKGMVEVVYSTLDANPETEKWASCGYGEQPNLMLVQRLPSNVKRCMVRYQHQSKKQDIFLDFACE